MADGTSDDFDDDFVDASDFDRRRDTEDTGDDEGQEESTDDEDPGPQVKRRGKDFSWVEVERFQHQDDFEQSALGEPSNWIFGNFLIFFPTEGGGSANPKF